MHSAILWQREGDRIRCHLCPNACLIHAGGRGICGARGEFEGELQALTYGLVSSMAVDPIEKKPLFHYRPGTQVLSLGSVGCSMRCGHCQNWEISRSESDVGVRYITPEDVVEAASRAHTPGIAFTYNEPIIWLEYVLDVGRLARERGLYIAMVTNGYVTGEGLDAFSEVVDVWRVDIKGFTDATYRRLCRVPHPEAVREQAVRAKHTFGMHVECVTNVVPTVNDSDDELRDVARWISKELGPATPWHVTRFMPYLEFADLPPTPVATLARAEEIGREEGLHFVYLGNVATEGGEDTRCPSCGQVAVARRGFAVVDEKFTAEGHCRQCGGDLGIVTGAKAGTPSS
ncbi:MAG: AmmeMemoRadiSam system radical SAM enzyme [Coriobacteriales bacterium]|nr:AmmeMemoRadiSam system radical SAM enzyme [Coriobacteriales bacterium]